MARLGRPPVSLQVRTLIRTLAQANPLWRAPRIHGELRKLGIEVSERTVSRILRTVKRPLSQVSRWPAIAAIDPTVAESRPKRACPQCG
jgi:hypothetical protein